jgi:hypothetical protein
MSALSGTFPVVYHKVCYQTVEVSDEDITTFKEANPGIDPESREFIEALLLDLVKDSEPSAPHTIEFDDLEIL